jgi:glycosyltransferase involved in cell wall biosynthesis
MHFQIFLDNIVFNIQKFGGASTYWSELQKRFIIYEGVNIIVQSKEQAEIQKKENDQFNPNVKYIVEDFIRPSIARYLPLTKRLPAKSLYHASYYRTCLQRDVVNIFTIHDFTHKKGLASKFPRKIVHINLTALGIRNADGIICISENTKKDLVQYFPQIPSHKIRVIYHGVNESFSQISRRPGVKFRDSLNLNTPFVLFIGKRDGYKKFDIAAEAIKKDKSLTLVIVGGGPLTKAELDYLDLNLQNRFIKFEGLSNAELNILYNYAFALIYPSIYEGFGFPVVEAMRAGCPVIATGLSSIPEVGGDAIMEISEISGDAIVEKLSLLKQDEVRVSLIKKGLKQCEKFSWDKCFNETFDFYKTIYNQKFSNGNDL